MSREKGKSTEGLFHEFRMRKSIEKKIKQVLESEERLFIYPMQKKNTKKYY